MHLALRGFTVLACAAALYAQVQPPQQTHPQQQAQGLETEWDIGAVLTEMSAHASRLLPVLDRLEVKSWVEKGASETYITQVQSCKDQSRAFADGAKVLARNPDRLSLALELYFRIQWLETIFGSLEDGIRRYQSAADARELAALSAENGANRERLQKYIVNLAAEREQEYQMMDREAQRCRGIVTAPSRSPGRKK